MERVLSCIQPTGSLHLGNYFGAVKNWVAIQNEYECFYGIVNLHAMTMPYQPNELENNTLNIAIELMSCGIDPNRSTLFVQSLVPQHTELSWILNCLTPFGELSRMTQFKDKSIQLNNSTSNFISAGLFTYPILQAADILLYKARLVPVGKDQEQHLELCRNIAVRFNKQFTEFFPEPLPLFTSVPKLMSLSNPSKKMSKSLGNSHYIGLFENEDSIRKKINSAITDGGSNIQGQMSDGVANLFNILEACDTDIAGSLKNEFLSGTLKYKNLKEVVSESVINLTRPFNIKKAELTESRDLIDNTVQEMSTKARKIAENTMLELRALIGLPNIKII